MYVYVHTSHPSPSRYVPTDWSGKTELTLEEVNRLNKLNLELAGVLAQRNPIYTPFQHGNFTCIMIKEVRSDVQKREMGGGVGGGRDMFHSPISIPGPSTPKPLSGS